MNAQSDMTSAVLQERAVAQIRSLDRTLQLMKPPSLLGPERFSLRRAILLASGRIRDSDAPVESTARDRYRDAGFERAARNSFLLSPAIIMHHMGARALLQPYQTTVSGSGAELVETTLRTDTFVDALRPRSVVLRLGAQAIGGLQGDVQIPRQDTTSSYTWTTVSGSPVVSGAVTESEGTFDSTPLTVVPCLVGGYCKASRLLMQQSELADFVIANDLTRVLGTALDIAAIGGSGSSGQPAGIVNTSGVNTVSGASFAYSTGVSALTQLTTQNAVLNRNTLGWATTPTVAGVLAQRVKITGFPSYIWDGNADAGTINTHPALSSANVPASTAIFGDWSQLLILRWGEPDQPIEIEVSAYGAGFSSGDFQIRAMMTANVAVRHPLSFTVVGSIT